MTTKMNEKFAKYWGECNLLMAIGAVLDPRYKMQLIKFCFPHIYSAEECDSHINEVSESLHALYSVYASIEGPTSANTSNVNSDIDVSKGKRKRDAFDAWAENHYDVIPENKIELDIYLKEGICKPSDENYDEFDALNWWKVNAMKFRCLSKMARDVLSIPITIVASEAAFSAGGRVLDQYRSSLKPETVQALICLGDWLRHDLGVELSPTVSIFFL